MNIKSCLILLVAMICSCNRASLECDIDNTKQTLITFNVIAGDNVTRSSLASSSITDIWMFDYIDGELINVLHKTEDFDVISSILRYGQHKLCFVASRGTGPNVSGDVITWVKPSDTFWATIDLNVTPSLNTSNVTLKRVSTRLKVSIMDEIPANAAQLQIEPDTWYYGLNVINGEGTELSQQKRTVTIPSAYIGTTGQLQASFFGLSTEENFETNMILRLLDGDDNVISAVYLNNIPLQRNRTTVCSGSLFKTNKNAALDLDDEWYNDLDYSF